MAIRAGQRTRAADWAGYAAVWDGGNETGWNSTSYVPGANPVGQVFTAPTGGSVLVHWHASLLRNESAAGLIFASVEVREGGAIGSGAVVLAASDDAALATTSTLQAAMVRDVSGLTPGAEYNVQVMHRNQASVSGAGTIFARSVYVVPFHA